MGFLLRIHDTHGIKACQVCPVRRHWFSLIHCSWVWCCVYIYEKITNSLQFSPVPLNDVFLNHWNISIELSDWWSLAFSARTYRRSQGRKEPTGNYQPFPREKLKAEGWPCEPSLWPVVSHCALCLPWKEKGLGTLLLSSFGLADTFPPIPVYLV